MERTSDQARQELETLKADLDSIVVNDPAAIERYQMRLGEVCDSSWFLNMADRYIWCIDQ